MVVCSIQANTNHLANSLDQRHHVFTTTFVHSRGSTSDWCMRECSHLNWASQSHVDQAGASFLHAQQPPTTTTTPTKVFTLLFHLSPFLHASRSHPPTSMYHFKRIREENNVLRQIICRIKPNHISTDLFTMVGTLDQLYECLMVVVNAQLSHFSTSCLHIAVRLKLHWSYICIDSNICVFFLSFSSAHSTRTS